MRPLQQQEAVMSSRIEGTRTTLEEVFAQEASGLTQETNKGSQEVRNYSEALAAGLKAMAEGRPLTFSLVKELHRVLLANVRGSDKTPGLYRTAQVWIGESESINNIHRARFVPPPPEHVQPCIDELEKYLAERTEDDGLVRLALAHYQFETIHPFNDGNGRAGRLLIVLQSIQEKLQDRQWLYMSPYIESRRQEYYDRLLEVSLTGNYDRWISFFLVAVRESAAQTAEKITDLRNLMEDYRGRLTGGTTRTPLELLNVLQRIPYVTTSLAQLLLSVQSPRTARTAIDRLVAAGILEEVPWKHRGGMGRPAAVYRCKDIIDLINRNVSI